MSEFATPGMNTTWSAVAHVDGNEIRIETGKVARQANGAVWIRQGDTLVQVAVVAAAEPRPGADFFPLTVEYRERLSAAGKFPGGYRKREGRISDREILSSRLVDRTIRPLFPEGYTCEVQVMATVLSHEPGTDPEALAITGAAAALTLSDVPFDGPVAGLRVVKSADGRFVAYPDEATRATALLDLVVSISAAGVVMVEGLAQEVSEADVQGALEHAIEAAGPLLQLQRDGAAAAGRTKREFAATEGDPAIAAAVKERVESRLREALFVLGKHERAEALGGLRAETLEALAESFPEREGEISTAFGKLEKALLRQTILDAGQRADGRKTDEIRPIWTEVGVIPRVHGSSLFTRGETQALVVTTLGTQSDEQEVETISGVERERFQLHYSFPPYSVGETRPLRGPGRREIGHGNLASRALLAVLPDPSDFPYTVKVESEITESNGSSSMATVCGGCLAMMDAGVPIRRPVAGIAMGLISDGTRTAVLSDILGLEDHLGDMDFKVAGTSEGITAVQLDNKLGSLPAELLERALGQARDGRLHILGEMAKSLASPRTELSAFAPRIRSIQIGTHRIRDLIGSGGRNIREVQSSTGVSIDVSDDGMVRIFATSGPALDDAMKKVQYLTGEPEVGNFYRGRVTGVKDFGCFVKLFEGIEGLVHVSELDHGRVGHPGDIAKEGEDMVVKVLGVEGGKLKLSRRAALDVSMAEVENA